MAEVRTPEPLIFGAVQEVDMGNGRILYDVHCSACNRWLCGDGVAKEQTAVNRFNKHVEERHS